MNHLEESVHAFRLLRTSTTKATDHELQKYDIFTRYRQPRRSVAMRMSGKAMPLGACAIGLLRRSVFAFAALKLRRTRYALTVPAWLAEP